MCEMTSIGEMSVARTTIPGGGEEGVVGDFRSDLTTSLTPRLRDLDAAAVKGERKRREEKSQYNSQEGDNVHTNLHAEGMMEGHV